MTKVIVDYSINRLIDHGKFLFERKVSTMDIINNFTDKEVIHNAAIQHGYVEPVKIHWRFMDRLEDEISYQYIGKYFYVGDDEYLDPWTLQPLYK
ncbi:hypothetical protein D3C76_187450 [compost metagenome]